VFDITQKIISAIDVVALNITSVDQISPLIRDIKISLNNYPNLPPEYTAYNTI